MTWLEISGTVGRVAACLGFFIAGMAIFYLLTKVIYRIPEKQQLERLHEPGKFRNAGIVIFGGVAPPFLQLSATSSKRHFIRPKI